VSKVTLGETLKGGALKIDIERLLETRLLIQANSGGGKSYAERKLLEETHGKVQQIVLDMEGEFATLREHFDFILAGKGGDIQAHPKTAALLARKVLELESSIIVDLYELKKHERIEFVKVFVDALVNAPKDLWHPVLIIIDEAHVFVPEKGESAAASAVIDLATRGRKRGFCVVLATQRLSKLNKDVAAECGNKLIGRTSLDIDRKRAGDELGFLSQKDSLTLRNLKPGQFYAFGPAIGEEVELAQIGQVKTTHPKAGHRIGNRKTAPTEKVKAALAKLVDLPKEAEEEARDRASLEKQVRELKHQLRQRPAGEVDPQTLEKAVSKAVAAARREDRARWKGVFDQILSNLRGATKSVITDAEAAIGKAFSAEIPMAVPMSVPAPSRPVPARAPTPRAAPSSDGEDKGISPSGLKILGFLATREGKPFSRTQIAAWTNISPKSSSFDGALAWLTREGFIAKVTAGKYMVDESRAELAREALGGRYEEPPRSLHDWIPKLKPTPARILKLVLEHPDEWFTRPQISQHIGSSQTSSAFDGGISELRSLEFLERGPDGALRLNPEVADI
jgi:hypothetical protein